MSFGGLLTRLWSARYGYTITFKFIECHTNGPFWNEDELKKSFNLAKIAVFKWNAGNEIVLETVERNRIWALLETSVCLFRLVYNFNVFVLWLNIWHNFHNFISKLNTYNEHTNSGQFWIELQNFLANKTKKHFNLMMIHFEWQWGKSRKNEKYSRCWILVHSSTRFKRFKWKSKRNLNIFTDE